jgi:diphthine methyl ester synthase
MTLYLIGIGLNNEKDITVHGLESVKKCEKVYLEGYTSLLQVSKEKLEEFYGKKIILANREMTEQGDEEIVSEALSKDVAFLIIGDVFSATTHIQLFKLAKEKNVKVEVINNASVLNAVGIVGLELYKYGKITSIPFIEDHPQLETPYNVFKDNSSLGLHTLFLLDLKPELKRFMTVNNALEILQKIEARKKENWISDETLVIGCARLGCNDFIIKSGKLSEIKKFDFKGPLHCLIIPGKMHFVEKEMLEMWK